MDYLCNHRPVCATAEIAVMERYHPRQSSHHSTRFSETEGAMVTTLCGQGWACPSSLTTGNPKIVVTCKVIIDNISDVTLKRTDTTLDLFFF